MKGPFISWLFFLDMFALRETQTALHSLEIQFTGMAITDDLPDIIFNVWLDSQLLFSYDTQSKEVLLKLGGAYPPLKNRLMEKLKEQLRRGGEDDLRRFCAYWMVSYNETWELQTTQVTVFCELDGDIQVDSRMLVAFDGETVCQLNEQNARWVIKKPEVTRFCNYLDDSVQWHRILAEECPTFLKIVLELFHLKENVVLELHSRDPGDGYACVVEHYELRMPAIYPAPRKVTRGKSWELSLSLSATTIGILISAVAFIIWWKKDAWGCRTQEHNAEEGMSSLGTPPPAASLSSSPSHSSSCLPPPQPN
ncbi:uncharacterized protein LOC103097016 isoform X2 [Monodelphis domestica]|nr:uncharacterized protein LOC103097016 isoform X2 [Monodelphis domestica]